MLITALWSGWRYLNLTPTSLGNFSFLLISSYTSGVSPTSLYNSLYREFSDDCNVDTGEIGLPVKLDKMVLPCGVYGRVTKD